MKKIIEAIKVYWKDPVWSKVIAAAIIFTLSAIFTSLYAIFKSLYSQVSFKETFKLIGNFLSENIVLSRGTLIIFIALYLILISKQFILFFKGLLKKTKNSRQVTLIDQTEPPRTLLVITPEAKLINFKVFVQDEKNNPLKDAVIILISKNNTYLKEITEDTGIAKFQINKSKNYKLYFSHSKFPAKKIENIEKEIDLILKIHSYKDVGSVIFEGGTGYIPGLKGRLNPILDTSFRTYLYADNISINGGQQQPVTFKINEPLYLEDCEGVKMQVTIKDIQGNSSLIEYVNPLIVSF